MSNALATVVAIPAAVLCALLLVAIGLLITARPRPQLVRRHSGPDTYWQLSEMPVDRAEGVLHREHRPRHAISIDDEDTQIIGDDLESYESFGRRSADSPVRYAIVPSDWCPPIGDIRIAILETPTAEYLFARKPKDQLTPRIVRGYMTAGLV